MHNETTTCTCYQSIVWWQQFEKSANSSVSVGAVSDTWQVNYHGDLSFDDNLDLSVLYLFSVILSRPANSKISFSIFTLHVAGKCWHACTCHVSEGKFRFWPRSTLDKVQSSHFQWVTWTDRSLLYFKKCIRTTQHTCLGQRGRLFRLLVRVGDVGSRLFWFRIGSLQLSFCLSRPFAIDILGYFWRLCWEIPVWLSQSQLGLLWRHKSPSFHWLSGNFHPESQWKLGI